MLGEKGFRVFDFKMDSPVDGSNLGKGLHLAHLNVRSLLGRNKLDM